MKDKFVLLLLGLLLFLPVNAESSELDPVITISPDGEVEISQTLNPHTSVSNIKVQAISDRIFEVLATDEKGILLHITQSGDFIRIATLGASEVNLSYKAEVALQSSGIWRLSYSIDSESTLILPPLSNIVSVNTIPIDINDRVLTMPPGDISLSYTIREVISKNFIAFVESEKYPIQILTGSKVEDFGYSYNKIRFGVDDRVPILVIVPISLISNPIDVTLDNNPVDFRAYYQNGTHSWIRIDPHNRGIIEIEGKFQEAEILQNKEGGGCLIATATFGSELSLQVQQLREIRDDIVLKTESGKSFLGGFNQIYYSLSPTIADLERENPPFKQAVKIVITPLLATLSILNYVDIDSEEEMLGFGIGIILLNIGIYFLVPIIIAVTISKYKKWTYVRTYYVRNSNSLFKSIINSKKTVKRHLFGIVILAVILLSAPSTYVSAQEYSYSESVIESILDQSKNQIEGKLSELEQNEITTPPFVDENYGRGLLEYQEALVFLEKGELENAKDHALNAMSLFEDALEGIFQEEQEMVEGQEEFAEELHLGNKIFQMQESILDSETKSEELKSLISNNEFVDISLDDFKDYEFALNLAKGGLANNDFPSAKTQLDVANGILDGWYDQIGEDVESQQDERIEAFVEDTIEKLDAIISNADDLPISQDLIDDLQKTLDILKSDDYEKILEVTSEDSEFSKSVSELSGEVDDKGKSEDKGKGKDKDEAVADDFEDGVDDDFEQKNDKGKSEDKGKDEAVEANFEDGVDDDFEQKNDKGKSEDKGKGKDKDEAVEANFEDNFEDDFSVDNFEDDFSVDDDFEDNFEDDVAEDYEQKNDKGKSEDKGKGKSEDKGKGKSEDKGKGKSEDKGKGKSEDEGKGKSEGKGKDK